MSSSVAKLVKNLGWVNSAFSTSRLGPYLETVENDLSGALKLYGLNLRMSLELFGWLAVLEVVLRNALMATLTKDSSSESEPFIRIWHEITQEGKAVYQMTATRLRQAGKPVHSHTLCSELPFSFWKNLLSAKYETTLWTHYFRHGFPHLPKKRRAIVFEAVEAAVELRNRIAHHEPIFRRELGSDLRQIQQIIGWISPEALAWARANLPKIG